MIAKCSAVLLFVLGAFTCALAEVIVVSSTNPIYVLSPRLRIRGTGFEDAKDDIVVQIGAADQPLRADVDYALSKDGDGDGIILKLLPDKSWVTFTGLTPPVPITLTSVKFGADSTKNLLLSPVVVAHVLPVPSLKAGGKTITATEASLKINGTGLIGIKKADLYFQPSIPADTYEDVSEYPLTVNQITLKLKSGQKWKAENGPLTVNGIDTGAGFVKLNFGQGVVVADVGAASSSSSSTSTEKSADKTEKGAVEFIDLSGDKNDKTGDKKTSAATATASSTTTTTTPKKESSGAMKFVDIFSSAFGTKDAKEKTDSKDSKSESKTTSTIVDTTATTTTASSSGAATPAVKEKATSAVQFVDIPTFAAAAVKSDSSKKTTVEPLIVDTTATSAASVTSTTFKTAAALADHVSTVTAAKSADSVFSDAVETLQKKIIKYAKQLEAAETVEESLKLADLLAKLSEALNNLKQ